MDVRASVKCTNESLERCNQAGQVMGTDGKTPAKTVNVKWDTDQVIETVKVSDLVELGSN